MRFRKILVALDGSRRSERALAWARLLARDQDLVLLRVIEHDDALDVYSGTVLPDLIAEGERYLHRISGEFEIRPRLIARVGAVAPTILQVAREEKAELIALTTQGSSEMARWIFGSTAEKLAKTSEVPILVVPSWNEAAAALKLEKVLVSTGSDTATLLAARLCTADTAVVPTDGPPGALLETAFREKADLLVAPVLPRRVIRRWWKSDETRALLRAASVPLLLVPGEPQTAAV